jgi:hypothetical protein
MACPWLLANRDKFCSEMAVSYSQSDPTKQLLARFSRFRVHDIMKILSNIEIESHIYQLK